MRHFMARFKVRPAEVAAAEKAIIAFVAKVADEPGTLRYESFREPDGVSYLHLMSFADDKSEQAHLASAHYHELLAACASPPVVTELQKISGAGR